MSCLRRASMIDLPIACHRGHPIRALVDIQIRDVRQAHCVERCAGTVSDRRKREQGSADANEGHSTVGLGCSGLYCSVTVCVGTSNTFMAHAVTTGSQSPPSRDYCSVTSTLMGLNSNLIIALICVNPVLNQSRNITV